MDGTGREGEWAGRLMTQRDKPRLALNNITAGVREREDANRTREAGCLDEIQGVVANRLKLPRRGAVGFIDWLELLERHVQRIHRCATIKIVTEAKQIWSLYGELTVN
jgi:hypothetical protein